MQRSEGVVWSTSERNAERYGVVWSISERNAESTGWSGVRRNAMQRGKGPVRVCARPGELTVFMRRPRWVWGETTAGLARSSFSLARSRDGVPFPWGSR